MPFAGLRRYHMLRLASHEPLCVKLLGSAIAMIALAGCAGGSGIVPSQTTFAPPNALTSFGVDQLLPDAATPPKCKGQKSTKEDAKSALLHMKTAGSSFCVPEFGGWGGSIQYPETYGSYAGYTATLISSTKAYKGSLLPPAGSVTPIFYLQIGFNSFPGFYPTLPKGSPLVSSHLTSKKSYTVKLFLYLYGLGWEELSSCYQVAKSSKYGGSLAAVGALFEKQTFLEKNGAIEVFKGQLVSNQCKT